MDRIHEDHLKNQHKQHFRKRLALVYAAAVFIMLGILICITVGKDKKQVSYGLRSFASMTEEWTDENGEPFHFEHIDSYVKPDQPDIRAYYQVPDAKHLHDSILFRSKNAWVSVWMDGTQVYETDVASHPFYNHSPGTRWNVVTIEPGVKEVELRITLAYHDGRAKIDNLYVGDRAGIIVELLKAKAFGIVICFLILFVGVLFILADVILSWRSSRKDYSLMYLGVFSIIASLWCLLETNVLQFLSPDLRILQVMDDMLLVLGSIPLFLYLDCTFGVFRSRAVRLYCILDLAYILLASVSQMCGWWDYHQTLNGAIASLGVVSLTVIICVVGFHLNRETRTTKGFTQILQQLGVIIIGASLAGDLFRYLTSDVMDRAMIIRIGLLGFVICFGAGNMRTLIQLVKQGMQAEIISKLAYSDGLTEVGNRTAYMERLDAITRKSVKRLGIIMLDINDLKKVNDTLGHGWGDDLIKVCVSVIEESFGSVGDTYRIGGDEFIVLITGREPELVYEEQLAVFHKRIREENLSGKYDYTVSIAHGAAFCDPVSREVIDQTQAEADGKMYENKKELKRQRELHQ